MISSRCTGKHGSGLQELAPEHLTKTRGTQGRARCGNKLITDVHERSKIFDAVVRVTCLRPFLVPPGLESGVSGCSTRAQSQSRKIRREAPLRGNFVLWCDLETAENHPGKA